MRRKTLKQHGGGCRGGNAHKCMLFARENESAIGRGFQAFVQGISTSRKPAQ